MLNTILSESESESIQNVTEYEPRSACKLDEIDLIYLTINCVKFGNRLMIESDGSFIYLAATKITTFHISLWPVSKWLDVLINKFTLIFISIFSQITQSRHVNPTWKQYGTCEHPSCSLCTWTHSVSWPTECSSGVTRITLRSNFQLIPRRVCIFNLANNDISVLSWSVMFVWAPCLDVTALRTALFSSAGTNGQLNTVRNLRTSHIAKR